MLSQAPLLFFLRTPVGDVLSSFAKDMYTLDEGLPDTLHMTTIYVMWVITSSCSNYSGPDAPKLLLEAIR